MNFIFVILDIFVFVLGVCIGSFLNCVIYRLEQKKKITGRSFCPNCKHTLAWQDLFPVFSFLFLQGKCRYCKKKISIQYPLVELATGVIFLLIFLVSLRASPQAGAAIQSMCTKPLDCFVASLLAMTLWFYAASALIIIFVYDLKNYIIPDRILIPAIFIAFIYRILEFLNFGHWDLFGIWKLGFGIFAPFLNYLLAVVIAAGFFFAIFLVSKGRWMGFGDVKLAVLMGLLLGLPNVLVALFLAFFFGAIIGIILMVLPASLQGGQKKGLKSEIPFGPFLIIGTFVALFWGQEIISWYLNLFI